MNKIPKLIEDSLVRLFLILNVYNPLKCISIPTYIYYTSSSYTLLLKTDQEVSLSINLINSIARKMTEFSRPVPWSMMISPQREDIYVVYKSLIILKVVKLDLGQSKTDDINIYYEEL